PGDFQSRQALAGPSPRFDLRGPAPACCARLRHVDRVRSAPRAPGFRVRPLPRRPRDRSARGITRQSTARIAQTAPVRNHRSGTAPIPRCWREIQCHDGGVTGTTAQCATGPLAALPGRTQPRDRGGETRASAQEALSRPRDRTHRHQTGCAALLAARWEKILLDRAARFLDRRGPRFPATGFFLSNAKYTFRPTSHHEDTKNGKYEVGYCISTDVSLTCTRHLCNLRSHPFC